MRHVGLRAICHRWPLTESRFDLGFEQVQKDDDTDDCADDTDDCADREDDDTDDCADREAEETYDCEYDSNRSCPTL